MNFDRVAAPYQTMEYLVFGRSLERGRYALLPALQRPSRMMLIGEGDGRFLERVLDWAPDAVIDVVEPSAAMIRVAQRRIGSRTNVRFHQEPVLSAAITGPYDLVVTHFVLDVFTPGEVDVLAERVRLVAPDGYWLISEFRVCPSPLAARVVSQAAIAAMYAFFRAAAGVRVRSVPRYAKVLEGHGMSRVLQHRSLNGLVRSELWSIC